ncbi:MAG: FAD-dependent oxidoreductase [Chthoniobacterales bacterium]|nr:FAD-dependent oxidoreductase [Chthoniobacterales bacterium]
MPHTPLAHGLRQIASTVAESSCRGVEIERVLDERAARDVSRRQFVRRAGLAAAAMAFGPSTYATARSSSSSRIVIIGAGLAGLTCAYRMKQSGIDATLYEASSRLGGRCWTRRGDFADGQIAEHGGELIDSGHVRLRQLAQELGLTLDDLFAGQGPGTEDFYHFHGEPYTVAEATNDFAQVYPKLADAVARAPFPTLYDRYTPHGAHLDQMSVAAWIEESVPGGLQSRFGQLLKVAYNIEYGAETGRQSALNLVYLIGYSPLNPLSLFGESDERYHIHGGNDQVVSRLVAQVSSQIVTGSALVAVRLKANGTYTLTFQNDSRMFEVMADKVVFALPFSILNASVDLTRAGFSELKLTAIRSLAISSNTKLHLQFTDRPWTQLGNNGNTYADLGYQDTWDVTRAQAGKSGILVNYTGGNISDTFRYGTPATHARQFLGQIEPVLPGLSATWNGRATIDYWPANPYSHGAYSYWQVGQYTGFSGIERAPEGNAHFCGEHTSIVAQGYLEGAVESGERAANEIASN